MPPEDPGSVTRWIGELKGGDPAAAQPLWERYFARLVRLARARLRASPRPGGGAVADEEDAALSAFDSFCAGIARGKFPQLADRNDLWRLLVVITARKVGAQVQRRRRRKRGGDRVFGPADLGEGLDGLDRIIGPEPTPEFAAMVADECRRRLAGLTDERQRQIALLKMEGYTHEEIAQRLGCGLRSVVRKVDLIRKTWLADAETAA